MGPRNVLCRASYLLGQVAGTDTEALVSVDSCGHLLIADTWVPTLVSDEAANDSDKSLTVPAGYWDQVLWIWVELTTTADAGTRQLVVEIQDAATDVIAQWRAGVTQAASLTYYYCFAPSNADLTAMRDTDYMMTPIPPTLILLPGYIVRVYDNNAIQAAADDMVIQMMVARKVVC